MTIPEQKFPRKALVFRCRDCGGLFPTEEEALECCLHLWRSGVGGWLCGIQCNSNGAHWERWEAEDCIRRSMTEAAEMTTPEPEFPELVWAYECAACGALHSTRTAASTCCHPLSVQAWRCGAEFDFGRLHASRELAEECIRESQEEVPE